MSDLTATALAQAARSLDEAARMHKRSEFAHRRQAQRLRQQLALIEAECARLGIRLVIEGTDGRRRHGHDTAR